MGRVTFINYVKQNFHKQGHYMETVTLHIHLTLLLATLVKTQGYLSTPMYKHLHNCYSS